SRRRHTRFDCDWSSDVCSSDLDRGAYGELVRLCQPLVYAAALEKLRDGGEAQELAHEAFVRAWYKLAQLREPAAFVGWVRQIARTEERRVGKEGRSRGGGARQR